jgi:serine/threonine protein kinase
MSDWIGQIIGKVRIEKLIARGGMAEVYYGRHITLNRPVAIKVLLSHLEENQELKTRFEREARVLAGLRHPNLVQIYDFDVVNGQPFIVMEYISGPTLSTYLRNMHLNGGRLTLTQIGRLLVMLAAALDYAHKKGVIHRDIKPANVLITSKTATLIPNQPLPEDAEPILTDFGLLLLTDASARSISGTIAGTPAYMSPEQARGERVDYRSDLYSLGVVLYEMLAGKVPFDADTSMGILMKHIQEPPPPIPDLPTALQNVLDRVLAKKPGDRYYSAYDMVKAFLEAAGLTLTDVAPGYSITPQPGTVSPIPPLEERATLQPHPTPPPSQAVAPRPTLQTAPTTLQPAAQRNKIPAWMVLVPIALVGLLGICLILTGGTLWFFRDNLFANPAATLPAATETAHGNMPPMESPTETPMLMGSQPAADSTTYGRIRFYNLHEFLDEVILTVTGLNPPPAGFHYEAWLVGNEVRRSLGVLELDATGNAEITFVDDQGKNLLARYNKMEITLEPEPDASPNPSKEVAFSSGIPPQALDHIKHLLVAFADNPNQTGMLIGMVQDAELLNEHANQLLAAYQQQDATAVRQHAEAMYNLLVGKQGQGYGDLDGDGTVLDPGDGFGLLLNGDQEGYIEGTISHAEFANSMPDASEQIHHHTPHITISSKNVEGWASELRDLLTKILADPLGEDSSNAVRQATELADRILHGRDLNGNEAVDPIEGEGGADTALEHAVYMIDMPILKGANMLPPPVAEPAPGSTPAEPPSYGP